MATYFEGAVKSGSSPSEYTNVGYAVFTQSLLLNFILEAGAGSDDVDGSITIPVGSQIHSINVDTLVAWDSVTSASLTIGATAGGSEFYDATDVKTAGREATTLSAADLALWDDVGSTNTLNVRVAQVGNTTAGQARVTVLYSPKS
jgi:hypothetical protein